jgi:PleD family two-component response regulator
MRATERVETMRENVQGPVSEKLKDESTQWVRNKASAAGFERCGGKRILIVEDDLALADFLATELRAKDHLVEMVHDGAAALNVLEGGDRYDLLVLDLNLPKVGGSSVLRRVKPTQRAELRSG